jgi:hypothetical protein
MVVAAGFARPSTKTLRTMPAARASGQALDDLGAVVQHGHSGGAAPSAGDEHPRGVLDGGSALCRPQNDPYCDTVADPAEPD